MIARKGIKRKRKIRKSNVVLVVWPNFCDEEKTTVCRHDSGGEALVSEFNKDGFADKVTIVDLVIVDDYLVRGRKPTKAMIAANRERITAEIKRLDPSLVVPLGSHAFEAVTDLKKITSWAGRQVKTREDLGERKCVPVFHPDQMAHTPGKMREFITQMRSVREIYANKEIDLSDTTWDLVTDRKEAKRRLAGIGVFDRPTFDFEATGLNMCDPDFRIRCMGVAVREGEAFVIDLEACPEAWIECARWVGSHPCRKTCHNAKFEIKVAHAIWGVPVRNLDDDTILLHSYLREEEAHALSPLAYQYTTIGGYDTKMEELKAEMGVSEAYANGPMDDIWPYCAGDCDVTYRLRDGLYEEAMQHPDHEQMLWNYRNISLGACKTLARVELNGMYINRANADQLIKELDEEKDKARAKLESYPAVKKAKRICGLKPGVLFNVDSTKQMQVLLFTVLKLPVLGETPGGGPSTKGEYLRIWAIDHKIAGRLTALRSLQYAVRDLKDYRLRLRPDSCINSSFRQDVVVTGRLSSQDPNLQNIAVEGRVKEVFTSRFPKGAIIQADFSQLEVRLLGSLSGEPVLHETFSKGIDAHTNTAAKIYGILPEKVTKTQRMEGKRAGFGVIYGIGPKKLAIQLGRPGDTRYAQALLDTYFGTHKAVDKWIQDTRDAAYHSQMAVSKLGRPRHLPGIRSDVNYERWRAERQATNHEIQSLGSDITLIVMQMVEDDIFRLGLDAVIIGQVHDSIIIDCPPEEIRTVSSLLHYWMTKWTTEMFPFLTIPLIADVTSGPNLKHQITEHAA